MYFLLNVNTYKPANIEPSDPPEADSKKGENSGTVSKQPNTDSLICSAGDAMVPGVFDNPSSLATHAVSGNDGDAKAIEMNGIGIMKGKANTEDAETLN